MDHELISRAQADVFFGVVLVLGLIAAPVAFLVAKRRGQTAFEAAALWGGPLVLIGLLWRVYNAITDRIGLQTVANALANAALFVLVGVLVGAGWVLWTRQGNGPSKKTSE